MKYKVLLSFMAFFMILYKTGEGQDKAISPSIIIEGQFHGETPPLRDLPKVTDAEWQVMVEKAEKKRLNPKLQFRSYPFAETALPKGPDPVWQRDMPATREARAPVVNISGPDCPYYPPDANGTAGPNHFMQTINVVYTIYNKSGTLVAGPSNMNTLFSGVTGSTCNDGDPIILYDEQANRWLAVEFSLCGTNDYMLIAVSTTNDPTGTWYKYSFDVADVPDYEKFGIWQDGYYMGTNNASGNDIYVFERSKMLIGQTAQAVGFNNPWRPSTTDGFMCVPPLDNDGTFAPAGEPGLFISMADDAVNGGTDQLWIYELDVDWITPANSTFLRTQQLNVASFDSNFGNTWDNIPQQGTTQKLDAIPQVIMNPPQYRNFGTYETIVCCHTVDVDQTDHAGIRWYELRRVNSGDWTVRQQGTYAPDAHNRWMGSIMLNGQNELALGYSISSSTMLPGIRYCGQSSAAYALAAGAFDVPEEVIQNGVYFQTGANRWGDYASMQVDPVGDSTFWFTSEYIGTGGTRKTKIASFNILQPSLTANFMASNITPPINTTVSFTDQSTGGPTGWTWSITPATFAYTGGTSATSQNPQVQFTAAGYYTVTLTVTNGQSTDSETKTNYINVQDCSNVMIPFSEDFSDGTLPDCWSNIDNIGNGQVWMFNNPGGVVLNSTTGSNGFAVLDSDFYGAGNSQNADLITPELDLSTFTSVNLTFQHDFVGYTGSSGTLSYTTNGGSTWTTIQTWTTTGGLATFNQDMTSALAGQASVRIRWKYIGAWGYSWAVDDISITGTGINHWTGATSGEWNVASNWSNGVVPASTEPVLVYPNAANWPVFSGNLTAGSNCGDITLNGAAQMIVTGNFTINSGYSLTFTGNGILSITGNWTRYGTFNPGQGTVKFTGAGTSTVYVPADASNITNYTLSTPQRAMTLLTGATTGPSGDNGNSLAPLGFTFNYLGVNYTQARLSTNGWLSMNESGTTQYANANLFGTNTPNTTLAPWFDDLNVDASALLSYKTSGTAPGRIFTAEWKNVLTYKNQATARINFQVMLYETSNIIEFHYGNYVAGSNSNSESASIGIEDATGGSGHFIEATTGSTTTGVTSLKASLNWPLVNYRFTPPLGSETFNTVSVNKSSGTADFNVNTIINGSFSVSSGSAFTVKNGKTLTVQGTDLP